MIVTHDPGIASQVDRVVAIRDGRTSTETVRQIETALPGENGEAGSEQEEVFAAFEEYVVLDSAGRLQIPREYLDELNIHDRAKLELVEGGILVKPVLGRGIPVAAGNGEGAALELALADGDRAEAAVSRLKKGIAGLFRGRRSGGGHGAR